MSTYPSIVAVLTDPLSSNFLNSPSHSGIETAQNAEIKQIETFVGLTNLFPGTLMYDVRSPQSGGGGHVQTAALGGTGQTSFNKGDLIVGQSSSVLTKLAVGVDTQALIADSTQQVGVKWGGVAVAANIQNQTYTYTRASVMSASVYGITPSPVVSMLTDGQAFSIKWPTTNTTSLLALTVGASGPSSVTALLKNRDLTSPIVGAIQASAIGIVEFDSVSSIFQLQSDYIPTYGTDTTKFLRNDATWNSVAALSAAKGGAFNGSIMTQASLQTVAHGLGKNPALVKVRAIMNNLGTSYFESEGTFDGVNTNTLYTVNTNSAGAITTANPRIDTTNIIHVIPNSGLSVLGTLSTDTTNLNFTWIVGPGNIVGSNPSIFVKWEAYA